MPGEWTWTEKDAYRAALEAEGDLLYIEDRATGENATLALYAEGRYELSFEREHGLPQRYPVRFNDLDQAVMHAFNLVQADDDDIIAAFSGRSPPAADP